MTAWDRFTTCFDEVWQHGKKGISRSETVKQQGIVPWPGTGRQDVEAGFRQVRRQGPAENGLFRGDCSGSARRQARHQGDDALGAGEAEETG
jgi:hypothetical protein